ncbi:relaxase domain-containing protein [Streptomyces sp. NPDC058217]|uniref:relaxase domain-containing protein n=1 Tax=Streptomyces sp. NPDC058217 TaxID=3346384 RepID=UPI0036ECCFDC
MPPEIELLGLRVGRGSTVQRACAGVIAARFRHYESRDGMPLLHDHVVLSVKIRRRPVGHPTPARSSSTPSLSQGFTTNASWRRSVARLIWRRCPATRPPYSGPTSSQGPVVQHNVCGRRRGGRWA